MLEQGVVCCRPAHLPLNLSLNALGSVCRLCQGAAFVPFTGNNALAETGFGDPQLHSFWK